MAKTLPPRSQQAWDHFRKQVTERWGGEVLEPEWLGALKKHRVRCVNDHECWPRPNDVQQGQGICRACPAKTLPPDSQQAWDYFRRQVAKEHGGVVLEKSWRGNKVPHHCRCAEGHECWPRPNDVQKKSAGICRICARRDPATAWSNFRQNVAKQNGVVLESKWLGTLKIHLCLCAKGHKCWPRPNDVKRGHGICRICVGHDSATAWANFCESVADKHGGTVLESEWLGAMTPHRCLCKNDHKCNPIPAGVQQGEGICSKCVGKDWDVFYVVRNPARCRIKFGITSRDGRVRLSDHRAAGYTEILRLKTELSEGIARHIEREIKIALAKAGAHPIHGREYFKDEYLALIMNEIDNWLTD